MKNLTKTFLIFLLLSLSASSCKKDDDNDWDPPRTGDYFTCLVNGERFETSSSFNCNGTSFYYYPAGSVGEIDTNVISMRGINCNAVDQPVIFLGLHGIEPFTGYLNFLNTESGESGRPVVVHGNLIAFDKLVDGWIDVDEFSPRQPNNGDFGTFRGTFEFTVTHDTIETVYEITEGEFRFAVPNIW